MSFSAAIATTAGRAHMRTVILHPKGRVSEIQRRQMTTVEAANIHNVAIDGTFDDCQALVKAMFGDEAFRRRQNLSAINSINWGRIMAQIVYYVTASLALGGPWRKLRFCVPSGNFGNVYAGYAAARMGLPIEQLIVATNRNDILARFFETGVYQADQETDLVLELVSVPLTGGQVTKLNDEGIVPHRGVGEFSLHGSTVVYRANHDVESVLELFSVPINPVNFYGKI